MDSPSKKAQWLAEVMHTGQTYDAGPFIYHPGKVVENLTRFGFGQEEDLLAAGWLHDVLEDTKLEYPQLVEAVGADVADLVFAVTNELGRNRAERHAKTYAKIASNPRALIVKLADRIANTENSRRRSTAKYDMYKKEWAAFKQLLRRPEGEDPRVTSMWSHLDDLYEVAKRDR
jgi:(p)ppGpp synthase/HD superfamily hydrolase